MDSKEVGARVRALREHLRLSRSQMADKLGLEKPQLLADVELGRQRAPIDLIKKIVEIFQVRPEWIVEGLEPMLKTEGALEFERRLSSLKDASEIADRLPIDDEKKRPLRDLLFWLQRGDLEEIQRSIEELGALAVAESPADYDPLSRRRSQVKSIVDQLDESGLEAVQAELEKIERVKALEERLAELEKKAG
jgi:transcriptional regulator with XRE-family HTH domain